MPKFNKLLSVLIVLLVLSSAVGFAFASQQRNTSTASRGTLGSISGKIYNDYQGYGGIQHIDYGLPVDQGQDGIVANWWVYLIDHETQFFVADTYTNAFGEYSFNDLPDGVYEVWQDEEDEWVQTFPENQQYHYLIEITNGSQVERVDFANFKYGIVSGCVFNDVNHNGIKDSEDFPISSWGIHLKGNSLGQMVEKITFTTGNGCYEFNDVWYGYYFVSEDHYDGWEQTYPLNPELDGNYYAWIWSGREIDYASFGNTQGEQNGTISGCAFNDLNRNHVWDAGEATLPNWTITLYGNGSRILTTGQDGCYTIQHVSPGFYELRQSPLPGWIQSYPLGNIYFVNIGQDEHLTGYDFGAYQNIVSRTSTRTTRTR